MYGRNLKAYNRTKLEAELLVASPHRVTQMLFEGQGYRHYQWPARLS